MTANTQDGLTSSTSLNDSAGEVTLREDPTAELDRVPNYALGEDRTGALVAVVDNQVRKGLGVKEMAVRMPDEAQQTSDFDMDDAYRKRYGYPQPTRWPLRWWYVRRVLTFWKMPYLIAEWSHRNGRPTLPESVQAWSQPLPPNNGPSPALQKANALVKTAMDKKGANFVDACKAAGLH